MQNTGAMNIHSCSQAHLLSVTNHQGYIPHGSIRIDYFTMCPTLSTSYTVISNWKPASSLAERMSKAKADSLDRPLPSIFQYFVRFTLFLKALSDVCRDAYGGKLETGARTDASFAR